MRSKKILVVGGSGIIGQALCRELGRHEYNITSIYQDEKQYNIPNHLHINVDINNKSELISIFGALGDNAFHFDVIIDLIPFGYHTCNIISELFSLGFPHIILLSTTLVYDRSKRHKTSQVIGERHPLSNLGILGGYVDKKLEVETYWKRSKYKKWTIIRPYHVLGEKSHIGCCPLHNRDPIIRQRILNGDPIRLVNNGEHIISYINPKDLAILIERIILNKKTYGKCYNAVHPKKVRVSEYYETLASLLGKKINIKYISIEELIALDYGWWMTAMEHNYSGEALYEVASYIPEYEIKTCLSDSLSCPPPLQTGIPTVSFRMNIPPTPQRHVIIEAQQ